jgi:hypothetical protein
LRNTGEFVLDFNDAPLQSQIIHGPWASPYHAAEIREQLNVRAAEFVRELFPQAYFHRNGRAAQIGDISGAPGLSMKIELAGPKIGSWYDHATGEGGGLIELFAAVNGMTAKGPELPQVLQMISEQFLGGTVPCWSMQVRDRLIERAKVNADKPKPKIDEDLPPPTESYVYRAVDGSMIAVIHRIEFDEVDAQNGKRKKMFLPWCVATHKAEMPVPRPLYHLPQLKGSDHVSLVEGERKVDWLTNKGVVATCLMGGANTALDKTDLLPLQGKHLIVWPDNDAPGREFIERIRTALTPLGCSIRVVQIPADKAKGWDVVDCIKEGGDPIELLRNALPKPENAAPPQQYQFPLQPFSSLVVDDIIEYLVDGLIPRTGLMVIWGPPKCGKSFFAFFVSMMIALGWTFRNRVVQKGPVVYCAFEGADGMKKRSEAFRRKYPDKLDEIQNAPFFLISVRADLVKDHFRMIADIRAQIGGVLPVAICLDTLNRSLVGSESNDEDMGDYIKSADAIGQAFNCLVGVVHHCGIDGTRPRGHTSLTGAVDAQVAVTRDQTSNIIVEIEWMKDGDSEGQKIYSQLETLEVGYDRNGKVKTSCVLIEAQEPPGEGKKQRKSAKLNGSSQIALQALRKAIQEDGATPMASNHVPPNIRVVSKEMWRKYAYLAGISDGETERAKQTAFSRAYTELIAKKFVSTWGSDVWLVE